jgi:hypothetical protein
MSTTAATIATYANPTMISTTVMVDGIRRPIHMNQNLFEERTQRRSTTCEPPSRALLEGESKNYNMVSGDRVEVRTLKKEYENCVAINVIENNLATADNYKDKINDAFLYTIIPKSTDYPYINPLSCCLYQETEFNIVREIPESYVAPNFYNLEEIMNNLKHEDIQKENSPENPRNKMKRLNAGKIFGNTSESINSMIKVEKPSFVLSANAKVFVPAVAYSNASDNKTNPHQVNLNDSVDVSDETDIPYLPNEVESVSEGIEIKIAESYAKSIRTNKYKAKNARKRINKKIKSIRNSTNENEMLVVDMLESLLMNEGFISIKKKGPENRKIEIFKRKSLNLKDSVGNVNSIESIDNFVPVCLDCNNDSSLRKTISNSIYNDASEANCSCLNPDCDDRSMLNFSECKRDSVSIYSDQSNSSEDEVEIIYGMMLTNDSDDKSNSKQRLTRMNRNAVHDSLKKWETELSIIGGAELVFPLYNAEPTIDEVMIRSLLMIAGQNMQIQLKEAVLRHDRPNGNGYRIYEKQERAIERYKSNNHKIWSLVVEACSGEPDIINEIRRIENITQATERMHMKGNELIENIRANFSDVGN